MTVGGNDADEIVVACDPTVDEYEEGAEVDAIVVALLDGEIGVLSVDDVDDGETVLDNGGFEEEAILLDVICMVGGVLEAALLLGVAVAVQYNCGTTL